MRKRRRKVAYVVVGSIAISFLLALLLSACSQVSYIVQFTSVRQTGAVEDSESRLFRLPSLFTSSAALSSPGCLSQEQYQLPNCQVLDVAVVCGGLESVRRVSTLVKSLVFHRRHPLHLHFVVDAPRTKLVLQQLFSTWALPAVEVSFYSIASVEGQVSWIPNRHYSGIFGLLKLTLPYVLPKSLKRVLVVDTDVLFVADVGELWKQWAEFGDTKAIGLAENLSRWYEGRLWKSQEPWPAIGRGFNTGLILLDLQRLRDLDWLQLWRSVAQTNLANLGSTALADQDIFNAVLKEHPELLHRISCQWNLQLGDHSEQDLCPSDVADLKVVHWNSPKKLKVKSRYAEFFRRHYQTFLEMDGGLLRREILKCPNATSPTITPSTSTEVGSEDADEDGCYDFRAAAEISYRTHLFFADYAYEPKAGDVSLVGQLSLERLQMLVGLVEKWEGPASIALYLSDAEARQFLQFLLESPVLGRRKDIAYHVVFKEGAFFPVNHLRNIALEHAETPFVYLSDIDFLPMYGLYDTLRQAIAAQGDMGLKALVVPAFETQRYRFHFPKSKSELLNSLDTGQLFVFRQDVWAKGHTATDYEKWRSANAPYTVGWRPDFEPYVVVAREGLPCYDRRFLGFGWNKVSHIMELDAVGYDFIVLPNAFMIHLPHAPSFEIAKYRSSPAYRRCLKGLKGAFMKTLAKKYSSRNQDRVQPLVEEA